MIPAELDTTNGLSRDDRAILCAIIGERPFSTLRAVGVPIDYVIAFLAIRSSGGLIDWQTGDYAVAFKNRHEAARFNYPPGGYVLGMADEDWADYLAWSKVDASGLPADFEGALDELWTRQNTRGRKAKTG